LVLGNNAYIVIAPNSTLHLENVDIQNVAGTNIACADNTGNLILEM